MHGAGALRRRVRAIGQRVRIRGAKAAALFDAYTTSRGHTAITGGAAAKVSAKEGVAWDGYITGTNLGVVPKTLVVQSSRTSEFSDDDADSTMALRFSDGCVDLVHVGLPDDQADAYDQGWKDSYWTSWKTYVKSLRSATR